MPFNSALNDSYFTSYENLKSFQLLLNPDTIIDHKLIVELFNDLYDYLDAIDINDNIYIITFLYNKLKEQQEENLFCATIADLIFKNITINYFSKIIDYYESMSDTDELKFFMNQYMEHFTFKIILLLYSYYFYIGEIISYENQKHPEHFFPLYILKRVFPHIEKIPLEDRKDKLYSKIINKFKIVILEFTNKELNTTNISLHDIIIKYNFDKTYDDINEIRSINYDNLVAFIHYFIVKLNTFYKKYTFNTTYANEYITIPQYIGNCWYISMLTCICYSDASKRLILSKNKDELLTTTEGKLSSNIFINIIYFIIEHITKDNKKYGHYNDEEKCEIFLFLKNNLMNFIYEKYNELNSANPRLYDKDTTTFFGTNEMYFKYLSTSLFSIKSEKSEKLDDSVAKVIKVGINFAYGSYYIINTLYNILNITTLYLFYHHDYIYYRQKDNNIYKLEETLSNPDIIFISKNAYLDTNYYEYFPGIIHIKDTHEIVLNGIIYKLDYILQGTDTDKCKKDCGHCISGIHYDGVEYCYDSQYSLFNLKCDENDIIIPCTLIRQNWSQDIKKQELCLYSIKKCFHSKTSTSYQELYKNNHYEDDICFNTKNKIIYAYFNTGIKYDGPSAPPSYAPSAPPSYAPSAPPAYAPSAPSSYAPSAPPSYAPSAPPSYAPSAPPSYAPSAPPSYAPSASPSTLGMQLPSYAPGSALPAYAPWSIPSAPPSYAPSAPPSYHTLGGNTTYKSTHKKVNIMNKNKTIIERTIYIDINKNKFIKFNKNYEPLSNFKYNRKNKYFYLKSI